MLLNSKEENINRVEEKAFHCTLELESEAEIPPSVYNKKFLRTLSIRSLGEGGAIRWDMLLKLTCLRTLNLHNCELETLPKDIDKLIHLRYLHLSGYPGCIKLPESLCNLFNLQTLKLEGDVRGLPNGIHKLVNLRHLYLGDYILLPKGLGKLTCLETLNKFVADTKDNGVFKKRHMKLEDLGKLNHLKGSLNIRWIGKVKDVGEAERAQLNEKEGLVELHLYFGGDLENTRDSTLLLEGLRPHPNLKNLTINDFAGTTVFPCWMTSLINLTSLNLRYCHNCECLGPFGKLPSLVTLWVRELNKVKRVGLEFLGIEANRDPTKMENCSSISFPKLKRLRFIHMRFWEEWELCPGSANEDHTVMPSLVSLEIFSCPRLKAPLPDFLRKAPLQQLAIQGCPNLPLLFQRGIGTKEFVEILTSPTSQLVTRSAKSTEQTEVETCSTSENPQILHQYDHEISPADDNGENLQDHKAPCTPTSMTRHFHQ